MKIHAMGFTTAGPQREVNEDLVLVDNERQLFVVADGMGGQQFGARASELAVETLSSQLHERFDHQEGWTNSAVSPPLAWLNHLRSGIQSASTEVFRAAQGDGGAQGMGTTLTALHQIDDRGVLAHVGDSRLYLLRNGKLNQLTTDHTLINDLVMSGELAAEKAEGHAYAHVLSRAVGVYERVAVDTLVFDLALEDRLLLCSDGLYGLFANDDELCELLSLDSIDEVMNRIESLPDERNASDNVSAVLLEVVADQVAVVDDREKSQEVALKMEVLQRVSLFQNLGVREIVQLVQSGCVRRVAEGVTIVEEGGTDRGMYVILSGQVDVTRQGEHLSVLSAGNHFGEMSLLLSSPRTATVTAVCDSLLLELPFELLEKFWRLYPRAGVDVLLSMSREFADRLAEANER